MAKFSDHANRALLTSSQGQAQKKSQAQDTHPKFDLADDLQRTMGVDLTRIDGIDVMVS